MEPRLLLLSSLFCDSVLKYLFTIYKYVFLCVYVFYEYDSWGTKTQNRLTCRKIVAGATAATRDRNIQLWTEKRQRNKEPAPPPTASAFKCDTCERTFKAAIGLPSHMRHRRPHLSMSSSISTDCQWMNDVFYVLGGLPATLTQLNILSKAEQFFREKNKSKRNCLLETKFLKDLLVITTTIHNCAKRKWYLAKKFAKSFPRLVPDFYF